MPGSNTAIAIHHVNFPTTDVARTRDWYGKVFGMRLVDVSKWNPNIKTLLLSNGKFDLYFTPLDTRLDMASFQNAIDVEIHFAVEVADWDGFLAHLDSLRIAYSEPIERPQDGSKMSELRDPDGTLIEIVHHADRPHPEPHA